MTTVIPGTSEVAHLLENVAAAAVTLTVDELALLDSLATRAPATGSSEPGTVG